MLRMGVDGSSDGPGAILEFQGFDRVLGTRRLEAAMVAEQRRNKPLVQADTGDKRPTHCPATVPAGGPIPRRKPVRPNSGWTPVQVPPLAFLGENDADSAGNIHG